jgi:hypothetical protein
MQHSSGIRTTGSGSGAWERLIDFSFRLARGVREGGVPALAGACAVVAAGFNRRAVAVLGVNLGLTFSSGLLLAKEKPLEFKSPDQRIEGLLNVPSLNRLGLAALSGTPSKLGGFLGAFDRNLETAYEAREAGPASIDLVFSRPQTLHEVRLLLGAGQYEWSLAAADSREDLEGTAATFRFLATARNKVATKGTDSWDEVKLSPAVTARALRLRVVPAPGTEKVVVRELNLTAAQSLEAIFLKAASAAIPEGEQVPLEVTGYFSGGDTRPLAGKALQWTILPGPAARMTTNNRIVGRRKGPLQVSVRLDRFQSPPLALEVVDAD